MSSKFKLVKKFWDAGQWSLYAVHNAVVKGWITSEEFKIITGRDFDPSGNYQD